MSGTLCSGQMLNPPVFKKKTSRETRVEKADKIERALRRLGHDVSGELRDYRGQWTVGGGAGPAQKERDSARKRRLQHIRTRGVELGYITPKNSSVTVNPMAKTKLPRTVGKQEKQAVDKWARENLPPSDAAYASLISHLAAKKTGGETQHPGFRVDRAQKNLIAADPSLADPKNSKILKQKMLEETGKLLKIENMVMAQLFPADVKTSRSERVRLAGGYAGITVLQNKALHSVSDSKGFRVKPTDKSLRTTNRQSMFPDRITKAVLGPHKGQYVRVSATGGITPVPAGDVARLRAEGKAHWTPLDASAKERAKAAREAPLSTRPLTRGGKTLKYDEQTGETGIIATSRDARRARAKYLVAQHNNLNPEDTFNQVNLTGDKTLLTDQNWQRPKVLAGVWESYKETQARLKELTTAKTKKYISDNSKTHADKRTDAEIRQAFKDSRRAIREEQKVLKEKHPELTVVGRREFHPSSPAPLSDSAQQAHDAALARADREIEAQALKEALLPQKKDKRGRLIPFTAKEQKANDATRAAHAAQSTINANAAPTTRSTRTGSGKGAGTGKPRKAPSRKSTKYPIGYVKPNVKQGIEASDTLLDPKGQQGTPLAPGSAPAHVVVPTPSNPKVTPSMLRPATQDELNALFPGTPSKPAHVATRGAKVGQTIPATTGTPMGVPPNGMFNIRISKLPQAEGYGQYHYIYDKHVIKSANDPIPKIQRNVHQTTDAHKWAASEHKFEQLTNIAISMPKLDSKLKKDLAGSKKNDTAAVVAVMRILGMRPSSEDAGARKPLKDANGDNIKDSNGKIMYAAKEKTYGATNMLREHVTFEKENSKDVVRIKLLAKAGHMYEVRTNDPAIFKIMNDRKNRPAGKQIFPTENASTAGAYIQDVMPDASPKDMRTYVANVIARREIAEALRVYGPPTDFSEFKNFVEYISTHTANQLRHGPTMSVNSYINPEVFRSYAEQSGVDLAAFFKPKGGTVRRIVPVTKRLGKRNGVRRNLDRRSGHLTSRAARLWNGRHGSRRPRRQFAG